MTKAYLEWIDDEILRHQTEIARLTVARSVIEEASDKLKRVAAPKLLAKPAKKRAYAKGDTRGKIVAVMTEIGRAAKPKEISDLVTEDNPDITAKMVWNALYNARITGQVVRKDGLYSLPVKEEKAA